MHANTKAKTKTPLPQCSGCDQRCCGLTHAEPPGDRGSPVAPAGALPHSPWACALTGAAACADRPLCPPPPPPAPPLGIASCVGPQECAGPQVAAAAPPPPPPAHQRHVERRGLHGVHRGAGRPADPIVLQHLLDVCPPPPPRAPRFAPRDPVLCCAVVWCGGGVFACSCL